MNGPDTAGRGGRCPSPGCGVDQRQRRPAARPVSTERRPRASSAGSRAAASGAGQGACRTRRASGAGPSAVHRRDLGGQDGERVVDHPVADDLGHAQRRQARAAGPRLRARPRRPARAGTPAPQPPRAGASADLQHLRRGPQHPPGAVRVVEQAGAAADAGVRQDAARRGRRPRGPRPARRPRCGPARSRSSPGTSAPGRRTSSPPGTGPARAAPGRAARVGVAVPQEWTFGSIPARSAAAPAAPGPGRAASPTGTTGPAGSRSGPPPCRPGLAPARPPPRAPPARAVRRIRSVRNPVTRVDRAVVDRLPGADPERAALGQLVGGAAAERCSRSTPRRSAQVTPGARVRPRDAGQLDDRGRRGVAGADHDGVPARERLRHGEVRDLVADQAGLRRPARRGRAARPRRPGSAAARCPTRR